jgi:hypothetical protein
MARAISKMQAAYGRLDHHFAHATGIDVVHETTDAVPVREKRMAAHARDGCAHRIVEVVERTELVRRRMARRAASSTPCKPHLVWCTSITSRVPRRRCEITKEPR